MHHIYAGLIVPSSIAVPIYIVQAKYKGLPEEIKILFYYLLAMAVIYLVSTIMALNRIHNLYIIHADTVIESIFLLRFFYFAFRQRVVRRWIRVLIVIFPVFCCVNFIFFQSLYNYNTYSRPIEAIIVITLCLFYWWYTGDEEVAGTWMSIPLNWVISGLLLYFSSAFLLFVFSNLLISRYDRGMNEFLWNVHATLILVMYSLFAIGFSKCKG